VVIDASARVASGISLRRLEKRFGEVVAVHPLDLDIDPGALVVLVGPSGCGKTTVLRMIAGLEDPTAGELRIGDRDVTALEPAERDVAMVFQNYALYPHMSVRENLAFGLRMRGHGRDDIASRVARAASVLGLDSMLDRKPAQLSGGQKQRVAFGRAMVRDPQVFLFDEPLSNLDARLRADMRREIADLHARLGVTMVYVTHDQVEAMTLGERIAVMRDGRLQQYAPPLEIYRRPANLYVATFIGTPAINLAAGRVDAGRGAATFNAGRLSAGSPAGLETGAAITIGARAEHVALDAPGVAGEVFVSRVQRVEQLGNESFVQIDGPVDVPWVVRAPADWPGRAGDTVGVRLDRTSMLWFDSATGARLG